MPLVKNILSKRPIVVGFGPAGIFASYMLALNGLNPIVFERGSNIDERVKKVEDFFKTNKLDEKTNVQFGEGGAGTFSDGKLNTLVKDEKIRMKFVFETFVKFGASEEILYDSKPHIGTDVIRKFVKNIRNEIIRLGGTIYFDSLVEDILIKDNKVCGVKVNNEVYETDTLILAIGHSARNTFNLLNEKGIKMENKPFAVGVRVIHKQEDIDKNQYPVLYDNLPASSYKLTYQAKNNRGVYSFCMCPGGYVVNASSQEGLLVVNGMSNKNRDSGYANSAIVVTVNENDYGKQLFAGIDFLEDLEKKAYKIGEGFIPVESFKDYESNSLNDKFTLSDAVLGKTKYADINEIFPEYINDSLKEGINYFDNKIKGFKNTYVLGVESRTSSPVRIPRSESFECNIEGIYPCGEGSGYAGGITTSAIDGIKVFESIVKKNNI